MATTFLHEMLDALDAGAPPSPEAVNAWAQRLPDAATAAHELMLVRQRVVEARPSAAAQVDLAFGPVLTTVLLEVTQRATDAALTDAVTGLPTRRLFERDCRRALAVTARTGRPVSVVMVDVDGLKRVNDTRGHAAGDVHLLAVADALRMIVREGDGAYRIGGDEFAVLLTDADKGTAEQVMSRFSGPAVSWGTATAAEGAADGDSLLATADAEMYRRRQAHRTSTAAPVRPRSRPLASIALAAAIATLSTGAVMAVSGVVRDRGDAPVVGQAEPAAAPVAARPLAPQEPRTTDAVVEAPVLARAAAPAPASPAVLPASVPEAPLVVALPAPAPSAVTAPAVALPPAAAPILPAPEPDPGIVPAVVDDAVALLDDTVCALLC